MACGAAVIGSDSGEIPHLIQKGQGGLIFPQRQAHELAAALRKLIVDASLCGQLAANGRRWVEQEISLPAVAKRMISAFSNA
jgi:glycosyltransferase involved in cell wall biosynthesis